MKLRNLTLLAVLLLAGCNQQPTDVDDVWLTPDEFAATAYGGDLDCEDFAIFRFDTLKRAGLEPWMVQGTKLIDGEEISHMWVESNGEVFDIPPAGKLTPVLEFNDVCYRNYGTLGCGDAYHIEKWADLLKRMGYNGRTQRSSD